MATITAEKEAWLSFPIEKTDRTPEGDLIVYGKVTDGTIDADDQIVDTDWSAEALKTWFKTGPNVRVQHQAQRDPAGVGLEVEINRDGDSAHWLKALVCEPTAKRLVEKGALRAFSVGIMRPKIVTHSKARGGLIAGGDLGEVSLVDRPANRNCSFSLVKAAKDGSAEWTGTMEGDQGMISKALAPSPADMPQRKDGSAVMHNGSVSPAPEKGSVPDMIQSGMFASPVANRLNDALRAEDLLMKRDFSASQRRSAAGSGAAMPDGSFPIKNGEDLGNAIHLAGHGKNPAAARAHIKRRAAALGMSDRIPDSWKKFEDGEDIYSDAIFKGQMTVDDVRKELGLDPDDAVKASSGACPTCKGKGSIRGGSMPCPDCKGKAAKKPPDPDDDGDDDDGGDEADTSGTGVQEAGNKAASRPPSHAEPSTGGSGRKPNSHAANPSVTDPNADDDEAAGGGGQSAKTVKSKRSQFECSACGCMTAKSAAFCSGCGAEFAGKRNDPAAGVTGKKPTEPLPAHREPDGPVEDLEPDMGIATDPDHPSAPSRDQQLGSMGWGKKPSQGSAVMADGGSGAQPVGGSGGTTMKTVAPYSIARAHDAFCMAWPAQAVLDEYPSLGALTDALDVPELYAAATKAVNDGEYELGEGLLGAARGAADLGKAEAGIIEDARAELHKAFQDMYPDVHLTPGMACPSDFQRGYISEGHAPLSAEPPKPDPSVPMPPEAPHASQFSRGPVTAGHERPSPGSTKDQARPQPGRHFYTNMAKTDTRMAMQAVHDHISSIYPDLCPLHAGTPLPRATGKGEESVIVKEDMTPAPEAPRQSAVMIKAKKPRKNKKKKKPVSDEAGNLGPSFAESQKALAEETGKAVMAELTKAFGVKFDAIDNIQKQVDLLGSQPDPAQAPNRGIITTSTAASGGARPAERRSLVDEAVVTAQQEKMQFLQSLAMSGDPMMREQAQAQINKMQKV